MIATQWLPVAVLELKYGDIVNTDAGAGQVHGWTWKLRDGKVHVQTIVLATEQTHEQIMIANATVPCWRHQ